LKLNRENREEINTLVSENQIKVASLEQANRDLKREHQFALDDLRTELE
jgi:hypothetical protein